MELVKTNGGLSQPVKIVLERRARPGAKVQFESWVMEMMETAARSPALQGTSVLTTGDGQYFILFRFASQPDLDHWQSLPEVSELLEKGETLAVAAEQPAVRTGFETWFTLPGVSRPSTAPPKWKMSLVTWLALLPQVINRQSKITVSPL
jgi:antibiotic biosynthesis monooxygenase (ABM) superfamily enzyme